MPNIIDTIKKIKDFVKLPSGWRFGEGGAISDEKIDFAERLVRYAEENGISRANAFAGADGEVLVSFYIDNYTIDLTLEADGSITFAKDFEDEQITFIPNLRSNDAYEKIWEFSQKIQNTSESFTHATMTQKQENLKVWLSSHRLQTKVSPLLKQTVRLRVASQYVSTSQDFIKIKPEFQKSTGTFPNPIFQISVG